MEVIKQLLSNEYILESVMAVIIVGLTQIIKLPIKAVTKHINNERLRKCINSIILLIPFAFGLLGEYLYAQFVLHVPFVGEMGGLSGGFGLLLHGAVARVQEIIKSKGKEKDNPYNTEEGKAVTELVDKTQDDGKIDKQDISAVDEFWNTISKDNKKRKK